MRQATPALLWVSVPTRQATTACPLGQGSDASGRMSLALGWGSDASGDASLAIGAEFQRGRRLWRGFRV